MSLDYSRPAFPLFQTSSEKTEKVLDDVSVFTRLSKIGLEIFPITIEDELKELAVARILISKTFGGSAVDVFPDISEKRLEEHGFGNLPWNIHDRPIFSLIRCYSQDSSSTCALIAGCPGSMDKLQR